MTATTTFTSQAAVDLERSEYLLRLPAHGRAAGIASGGEGVRCIYCEWSNASYRAERLHEDGCPIRQARKFLRRVHDPRSSESGAGQSRRA